MKRLCLALAVFLASTVFAANAQASPAVATANINLRAGPDSGYPAIVTLRRGEQLDLLGCIQGLQWCEVETAYREHGWVAAYYLQTRYDNHNVNVVQFYDYGGSTNIIIFRQTDYWDRYYRTKYFYKDRDRWAQRDRDDHDYHHDHDGNHDNDDDNDHGHHSNHGNTQQPVVVTPQRPAPAARTQSDKWKNMNPNPGKSKYNPLCNIGQSDC